MPPGPPSGPTGPGGPPRRSSGKAVLVVLGALVIVLGLIGGAALFARGIGDDDDGGSGRNGGGNGSGSQSQDGGAGGDGGQVVGDNCEANLPPELNLVECGFSVSTQGEGMTVTEASVGYMVENVSGETITVGGIDIEGADAEGDPVRLAGLSTTALLHPGERLALGGSGLLTAPADDLDFVMIAGDNALVSRPFPEMIPGGVLRVSDVAVESDVEMGPGELGAQISYTVTSEMDRRVNATAHVLLRNDQGAIIGYTSDPVVLQPSQSVDREVAAAVPNVVDVEVHMATSTALE